MIRSMFAAMISILLATAVHADVRLPGFLSSHMVLQRGMDAPIWGWAAPGEQVTVTVGDVALPAVRADDKGRWRVLMPAADPGAQSTPMTITVAGQNTITLENVVWGDVWICSGQSNMAHTMSKSERHEADIAAAEYPGIRLLTVTRRPAAEPQDDVAAQWTPCRPDTVRSFSAVAYYFGKALHEDQGVPIGLINTSVGGTPAEAWTPREPLAATPQLAPLLQRAPAYAAEYPARLKKYEADLAAWEASDADPKPRKPREPRQPDKHPEMATVLYNSMIRPLTPLRIKGAIWYQGEANATRAEEYKTLLPAMIAAWREAWAQGDFSFGIVQLPNFRGRRNVPSDEPWARLREAQAMTAATVPNCGLAVTIDIGDPADIHPANKHDVGHRLALWALSQVYGREIAWSGPRFAAMAVEGAQIRVTFNHADGGLRTSDGKAVEGFAIAGEDQKFVWAKAVIDGASVRVSNPAVPNPVAVRYAWANNPACNLTNATGIPTEPFRTDAW